MVKRFRLGVLFWVLLGVAVCCWVVMLRAGISFHLGWAIWLLPAAMAGVIDGCLRPSYGRFVLKAVALLLGAFVVFGAIWGMAFHRALEPVHDMSRYGEILARYGEPEISPRMAHFPKALPEDASDVLFYHLPGFLQGADVMELSFVVSLDEAEGWRELHREKATMTLVAGEWKTRDGKSNNLPTPRFETLQLEPGGQVSEGVDPFEPGDVYPVKVFDPFARFDVFELSEVYPVAEQPEGFYWNHGKSYGVAVGKTDGTVVCWSIVW